MPNSNGSSEWSLHLDGLERGTILGRLVSAAGATDVPEIEVCVDGEAVGRADVQAESDGFSVSAPLPTVALRDGLTAVVFRTVSDRAVLGTYPLRAGQALDGDIAADLAMLKDELQALKSAFLADAHVPKLRAVERDLIIAEAVDAALVAGAGHEPTDRQSDT